MVAEEQEMSNDDHSQDFDHHHHEAEEEEETLSLSDLVEISSCSNGISNSRVENQSVSDDGDFFGFFSEDDFTASSSSTSASYYPNDNIIFCGKLIPYKEPAAVHPEEQTQNQQQSNIIKKNHQIIFPSKAQQQEEDRSIYDYKALSQRKGYQKYSHHEHDFSVNKEASTLAAASVIKPKWYLLLAFGHERFHSEMKLRDLKNRQSRRVPPPARKVRWDGGGGEMVKSSEKRSPWKGFWALLQVLGCKNQQANVIDCIQHV